MYIWYIAYNNIILKGFLAKILEDKIQKEKEEKEEEEKARNKGKKGDEGKGKEGKDIKKDSLNVIIEKYKTFLSNLFEAKINKNEVIKNTMKDNSKK